MSPSVRRRQPPRIASSIYHPFTAEVPYPAAERIVLVLDNLNIHSPASLYEAFPPAEAKRLADKLAIHHTPRHGSCPALGQTGGTLTE